MCWRTVHHLYGELEVLKDQNPLPVRPQEMHVLAVIVARSDASRDHTVKYNRHVRLMLLGDVLDLPAFQGDLLPQVAWREPVADELAEGRHDCLWLGFPPEAQLDPHSLSGRAHKLTYSVGINHDPSFFLDRHASIPDLTPSSRQPPHSFIRS